MKISPERGFQIVLVACILFVASAILFRAGSLLLLPFFLLISFLIFFKGEKGGGGIGDGPADWWKKDKP